MYTAVRRLHEGLAPFLRRNFWGFVSDNGPPVLSGQEIDDVGTWGKLNHLLPVLTAVSRG